MKRLRITIGNRSYDVLVEDLTDPQQYPMLASPMPAGPAPAFTTLPPTGGPPSGAPSKAEAGVVTCPLAGVIKEILVKPEERVIQGQRVVVLEAMKMENQITTPLAGTVKRIGVTVGESVREGHVLLVVEGP
jgi:biotin carboxyl carrier protein